MQFSETPNLWKQSDLYRWSNSNYKMYPNLKTSRPARCRGGWGRGRSYNSFNPCWSGYNLQNNFPDNQDHCGYSNKQRGSRNNEKPSNEGRFNKNPRNE